MAQSIVATNLLAAAKDSFASPCATLAINWHDAVYSDETVNLLSAHGNLTVAPFEDGMSGLTPGGAATCELTLDNTIHENDLSGRYSPLVSTSPLYQWISNGKLQGKALQLSLGYLNAAGAKETVRMFTGNIYGIDDDSVPQRVSFACQDLVGQLMHQRVRTAMYQNQTADQNIDVLCTNAGITGSARALDHGTFVLPYWWADSESMWEEMGALAQADGGRVRVDQNGVVRFDNMHHWLLPANTTSQYTFTGTLYKDLHPNYIQQEIWDGAVVEYAPLQEQYTQVVYDYTGDPIALPPSTSTTFGAQLAHAVTGLKTPLGGTLTLHDGGTHSDDIRDYVFVSAGGDDITDKLTVSLASYAQHVDVTLTNSDLTRMAYMVRFQLRGRPVLGAQLGEVQVNSRNSSLSWPRIKEVRGRELIQTSSQADAIARFLRDRQESPRLIHKVLNVPCAPWLEPGDRVTVVGMLDANTSAWTRTGFIVGIQWRYDLKGFYADYDVLDDASLFPQGTTPFILGTSKYGTSTGNGLLGY